MSTRPPTIVVTLPARTVREAQAEVREAAESGADLAELRFDRWQPEEVARAGELFPAPLPLIATLRSRAEGGEGADAPAERAELLGQLGHLPFRWIDLEIERDDEEKIGLPPADRLGRILSTHRLGGASPAEWSRWIREPTAPGRLRKVVARAGVGEALRSLIPALPPPGESSVVALTTGPSGSLWRALSGRFGLPWVYASLPDRSNRSGRRAPVEPSQIPVDRLRSYFAGGSRAPLFAIVGHPIAHSRSPALHGRWMLRAGRAGLYIALDVASEEEFVDALPALAEWGFRGLNVTHPWKAAALAVATSVGPGARTVGVANCLTLRSAEIEAENTDLTAMLRRMEELTREGRWDGRSVSVVGTGGAARATLAAANALGARSRVYGRTDAHVRAIAREFGAEAMTPSRAEPDGLVVQATDVGRAGTGPLAVPLARLLRPGAHLIDWVYAPDLPFARTEAQQAHATYEEGTRLLVYQAAASFGIWWGEEPEERELALALKEEGCEA